MKAYFPIEVWHMNVQINIYLVHFLWAYSYRFTFIYLADTIIQHNW